MKRAWAYVGCLVLLGCQAVSGLNDLRFVSDVAEDCTGDRCDAIRTACDSDSDCEQGRCYADMQACVPACDFASGRPCSGGSVCAHITELDGDYCVEPSSRCATDGRCDEPEWGSRRCVAGSDAVDCACKPQVAGATCDLITQCGCGPGTHCAMLEVQGTRASVGCSANVEPTRDPGAACNAELECPIGYSCWRGLCEKYCTGDGDCASGRCVKLRNPDEVGGVGVCALACDFELDRGCAKGTSCARAPDGGSYCFVPRQPCPFENDGVCDEPKGSRICAAGSDVVDCS